MFTSKIVELVNKNFESVQPMLNLDSIYFEQAISSSTDDSSYTIERQSIYKHTVPLVNGELSKKVQGVILVDSSVDHIESDERILISSPLNISNINSSYIELKSTQYYCLNDLLSNYVTNSSFEETYNNTYDKLDSSIKQYYIDKSSTLIDNLQTYYEESSAFISSIIDKNFIPSINGINGTCDDINVINSSIQSSLKFYDQNSVYINKKLVYEFNAQLLELLNISDERYRYEQVYIWEVFEKMMVKNLLKIGKTYNILYYPRTKIIDSKPIEYNKFSIPIILEVTAVSESKISNNVKVKNSIDTITKWLKQDFNIFEKNNVIDIVNVYKVKDNQLEYELKPIFLTCFDNNYPIILYYDDIYGYIAHGEDIDMCSISDTNKDNAYSEFADSMARSYSYSTAYMSTLMLRYCLFILLNTEEELFDNYDVVVLNDVAREVLDLLKHNLETDKQQINFVQKLYTALTKNDQTYIFDLDQSDNIFNDILGDAYRDWKNLIYNYIDDKKENYIENNINIIYNYFDNAIQANSENEIFEQIKYYITNNELNDNYSDFYSAINIYYDSCNSDNFQYNVGLLYNGSATLYEKIYNLVDNKFDNSNWIFSKQITSESIYLTYYKVLQGGKVIPYENWKMVINIDEKEGLLISHLVDEYNNEGDYDFRSIPTFVNEFTLDSTNIFADDLFWQSYYRMAANTKFDDILFNVDDKIKQNYTEFETSNNKILNNSNTNTIISYINDSMINSLYYNLLNRPSIKNQNLSNINILNNTYNNDGYCIFIGAQSDFINNIVDCANNPKLQLNKSNVNNSTIFVTEFFDYLSNINLKNSNISHTLIQHRSLDISNSEIYSSTIMSKKQQISISNSKIIHAFNPASDLALESINNSTLIGTNSQQFEQSSDHININNVTIIDAYLK